MLSDIKKKLLEVSSLVETKGRGVMPWKVVDTIPLGRILKKFQTPETHEP